MHETASSRAPEDLEGTLQYIAPEQTGRMNRSIDGRADLYALGVTFYEMLTRRLPFEVDDRAELVHRHLTAMPLPPRELDPDIPEPLSRLVMKLIAKDPEDRYQSGYGLSRDLAALAEMAGMPGERRRIRARVRATYRIGCACPSGFTAVKRNWPR